MGDRHVVPCICQASVHKVDVTVQAYAVCSCNDVDVSHNVRFVSSGPPASAIFNGLREYVLVKVTDLPPKDF